MSADSDVQYVYFGATEWKSLVVGLVIGAVFGALQLPIPVPGVVGGNLAITGTFVGMVVVGLAQGNVKLGKPSGASMAIVGPALALVALQSATGQIVSAFTITMTGIKASIVGLVIGAIFEWLDLPIPVPGVLGGILAIWGVFVGSVVTSAVVGAML
ncbi:MAG: XapX domain-containing protein [Haloferacaceae archaeon]